MRLGNIKSISLQQQEHRLGAGLTGAVLTGEAQGLNNQQRKQGRMKGGRKGGVRETRQGGETRKEGEEKEEIF